MRCRDACIISAVLGISALCSSEVEAAKEWAPQEVAAILAQSYAQLLMRPLGTEPSSFRRTRRTNNGIWCSPVMRCSWQKARKV